MGLLKNFGTTISSPSIFNISLPDRDARKASLLLVMNVVELSASSFS